MNIIILANCFAVHTYGTAYCIPRNSAWCEFGFLRFYFMFTRLAHLCWIRSGGAIKSAVINCRVRYFLTCLGNAGRTVSNCSKPYQEYCKMMRWLFIVHSVIIQKRSFKSIYEPKCGNAGYVGLKAEVYITYLKSLKHQQLTLINCNNLQVTYLI